jgi:ABC-type phosphate/phosphonate transport system substrate-binding protein
MLAASLTSFMFSTASYSETPLKRTYTIGYMKNIFSEVDINDAHAAIKLLTDEIVRTYHYSDGYNLKAKIYSKCSDVTESMKDDSLAVLSVNPYDYLTFGDKIGLDPILAPSSKGDIFEQYSILIRKVNNFNNIKDLKGIKIGLLSSKNHIASRLWLDVLLAKNNIPDKSKFFNKINTSEKESQLILDLFFGHLDACIVSTDALILMKELNPQIGENIISIQNSPKYLWGMLCFTKIFTSEKDRNIFYTSAIQVNGLNPGKQLFSLVKINKLEPFKSEYLNSFRELFKDYNNYIKMKKLKNDEFD